MGNSAIGKSTPHVVIIGAGFAGLNAAQRLAGRADVRVTIVDQRNHHLFQPLLYQVATAGLNPSDIAAPIRAQFSDAENVAVNLAAVSKINLNEHWVESDGLHRLNYDYLIVACGAQHSYFGHPEWEEFAPGLKTVEQATEIRRRILIAFERAESEPDLEKQKSLLTFVVVGGGPTGVELAGAIAEISRTVLVDDFRRIQPASAQVILIEAAPRILTALPEKLAERATRDLEKLGVTVRIGALVTGIDAGGVSLGTERIHSTTVLWAAGVQANQFARELGVPLDKAGRIKVNSDLSIPAHANVFATGDIAHYEENGQLVPGLAPAAIQMGRTAARNIIASITGKPRVNFHYRDKGSMATIGKRRAVGQIGKLLFSGTLAWFAWLFVHVLYLIGFRNRIRVVFDWIWSYAFSRRGARLITEKEWRLEKRRLNQASREDKTAHPG